MHRSTPLALLTPVLFAGFFIACGDSPTDPTDQPEAPVEIIEPTISGTLTVNGGATHPFLVQRAGNAVATLTELLPDNTAVIGLSMGTWNGVSCQIIIANDNATLNPSAPTPSVVGTASAGNFCVRVHDVGKLTQPVEYSLVIRHF
jgi:hypothetical protein